MANAQRPGRQYPAPHMQVTAQVAEALQGVGAALRRALGHADGGGHLTEIHGAALATKRLQDRERLLHRLVEERISILGRTRLARHTLHAAGVWPIDYRCARPAASGAVTASTLPVRPYRAATPGGSPPSHPRTGSSPTPPP